MARLFADENFPLPTVQALRRLGHDVVSVADVGRGGQRWSDPEVLQFARGDGRILLTLNRKDFLRLHRSNPEHAGLILCTLDLDFEGQAERIAQVLAAASDLSGLALRVNRPST
jgi:Domain of unknown function (DUF5615)